MRDNKAQTEHVTTPERLFEILLSGKYHVSSWDMVNDDVIQIMYKCEDGFVEPNPNTNVVLAA